MRNIGIMQGRLSPAQDGRLQFFPKNWQSEFKTARETGFSLIEWNLDREEYSTNPFWIAEPFGGDPSLFEIKKLCYESGVNIRTICLDYFMNHPLIESGGAIFKFQTMLHKASLSGIKIIGLPLHEDVALNSAEDRNKLRSILNSLSPLLDRWDLVIALEAEFPVNELRDYVLSFDNSRIGICYDIGNMASMGYDLSRDIRILGNLIKEVHLKDRRVGSTQSVYLGTGDVDFEGCLKAFHDINFSGPYILQAWREEDYLADAKNQLEFVREQFKKVGQ